MKFNKTAIDGVYTIDIEPRHDERGFFARAFCRDELQKLGIQFQLEQANVAHTTRRATMRGLHWQAAPSEETKIVRCIRGQVFDVCVDMRAESATYLKWVGTQLSSSNHRAVLVPAGVAHGYLTLVDDCEFFYMVSEAYAPEHERGMRWDDPAVGITWPITPKIVSEKDQVWALI